MGSSARIVRVEGPASRPARKIGRSFSRSRFTDCGATFNLGRFSRLHQELAGLKLDAIERRAMVAPRAGAHAW
jgi:hypothetical protein